MTPPKIKFAVIAYLAGMVVVHGALFWNLRQPIGKGYSDFAIYYGAGTAVRKGLGRQLYDGVTQFHIQREFSPEVEIRVSALPYNHPAFEALLFVPFTFVSYVAAFVLWDLANLAMLAALPFLLRPHLPYLQNCPWILWMVVSLGFFPVFVALLQGQDSILLLFLYTLAFVCLKRGRDAFAGGWLAIALFKPQLVLLFILFLLAQGRKKVLYGFLPMAGLVTLMSLAIVGLEGMTLYPAYVWRLESSMAGAIMPADMPNLRGLAYLLLGKGSAAGMTTLVLSAGMVLLTAWLCHVEPNKFALKFSLATVATVLVSYHLLSYDLSVLLLPLLLLANDSGDAPGLRTWPRKLMVSAAALMFFSPALIWLMGNSRLGWAGAAVLLLFTGLVLGTWPRAWRTGETQ